MDTNVVYLEKDPDIDLMPKDQEVTPLASPDLWAEQVPNDQGDTKILEENPKFDVHNISFNE